MALTEDPQVFLDDFGVSVTAGAVSGLGILDQNSELIIDDRVIFVDYALTCESSKFGTLTYQDPVTVAGIAYTVKHEAHTMSNGLFCVLELTRVTP